MDEIETKIPYRYGFPAPIPAMPVATYPALLWGETVQPHFRQIETILSTQRVDVENIRVVRRGNGGADESIPTLCVTANEGEGNWLHAIKEIRKYLQSVNLTDLAIEILDSRIFTDLYTFTILPTEVEIISQWYNDCRPQALELLGDTPNAWWATLNVFHRGVADTRSDCFPTVLLSVPDPSDPVWHEEVYPRLIAICQPRFRLEILYYSGTMLADDRAELVSAEDVKSSSLRMGSGCGPTDSESSRTLGGAVELRKGSNAVGMFGLTNTHVIHNQPFEQVVAKNSALRPEDAFSRDGLTYVSSPSTQDTNSTLRTIKEGIDGRKQLIDGTPSQDGQPEKLGLRAQVEMGAEKHRDRLEKNEQYLEREQSVYDAISNADRRVGPVYAASGFRAIEREIHGHKAAWAMEWALVNLEHKTFSNVVPLEGKGEEVVRWMPDTPATGWLPIEEGMAVAKCGRTSGWTIGEVSAIRTDMGPALTRAYGRSTACFAVLPRAEHEHFAKSGDSGAVVLQYDPTDVIINWVGLLFAAEDAGNVAYITSIDLVFEDIKKVTGCDAVRPATSAKSTSQ